MVLADLGEGRLTEQKCDCKEIAVLICYCYIMSYNLFFLPFVYSLSVHKAFFGILKETDDIAGQHEVISEELQSKVYKELQNLHNEAKQERKKVTNYVHVVLNHWTIHLFCVFQFQIDLNSCYYMQFFFPSSFWIVKKRYCETYSNLLICQTM